MPELSPMPSASQPSEPGPVLALSDLFVPSSALAGAASRIELALALPDGLARQAEALAVSMGLLPDTLHCAAWLLLLRHWCGVSELVLWECVPGAGGSEAVVGRPCSVDLLQGSAAWLRTLDARRRSDADAEQGMTGADMLWLGLLDAAAARDAATASALAVGVRAETLVVFTSAS